jgi:hypothetical protein
MDVRIGGAWKSPTTAEAYIGGGWRNLQYGEAYIDGAWRQIVSFIQPLTLSANDVIARGDGTLTTPVSQATPTGGLGPFTYSWTLVSSLNLTGITINSPNVASTTFTATTINSAPHNATFRCTCTDSRGTTATATMSAQFTNVSSGGGTE